MGSLARRVALAVSIACAPVSAARADEPLPLFPGPRRIAAEIRLHGAMYDGVGFLHPVQPLHASVILIHRRTNHGNPQVRGYDVAERVPKLAAGAAHAGDPRLRWPY